MLFFSSQVKFVHLNPLEFVKSSIDPDLLVDPITSHGYNADATRVRVSSDSSPNSFEMETTFRIAEALIKILDIFKDLQELIGQTLVLNFRWNMFCRLNIWITDIQLAHICKCHGRFRLHFKDLIDCIRLFPLLPTRLKFRHVFTSENVKNLFFLGEIMF